MRRQFSTAVVATQEASAGEETAQAEFNDQRSLNGEATHPKVSNSTLGDKLNTLENRKDFERAQVYLFDKINKLAPFPTIKIS